MASNIVHYPNFSIVEGDVKVNIDFGKVSDRINRRSTGWIIRS